ncbi:alpha amylase, catalytic domain protein [Enterococcus faecalis 13-SD-W-01]|nr:alpha amylase, catalytic domain protein [Enterococcus faecalis 13-SD-W-01]
MKKTWWENVVGYQIYPRSFKDTNGDGTGDLKGVIEKLPYLKELGIDFIWLNPVYPSPNVDNGYDISDYQDIQEEFGTLADFKELLKKAHDSGIKIIMDLVVNHTSDQHPWFIESRKSKDNPYRDYYHWHDAEADRPPNEWQSFFGGSAWTFDEKTKQSYLHAFAPEQPDLNWKNPKVREEIHQMIRWWLDMGIDGFRLDAISHIQKEPWEFRIEDNPWAPFMNVEGIEEYMLELRDIFNEYPIMTVGEASGVSSNKASAWTCPGEKGYIDMIFELEHQVKEGKPGEERINLLGFKTVLARWQKDLETNGWNALYVENHDNPRINSILGNETAKSAKAIGLIYFFLKGTPFIYQGQELGMTNYPFTSIDEVDASDSHNRYEILLKEGHSKEEALARVTHWTRDHSRTPMQWTAEKTGGFTTGKPWLTINPNTAEINAEAQKKEADSVWHFYQEMIKIRKQESAFAHGTFDLILGDDPDIFAYLRRYENQVFLVLANISGKERKIALHEESVKQDWKLILSNTGSKTIAKEMTLAPYDALLFKAVSATRQETPKQSC